MPRAPTSTSSQVREKQCHICEKIFTRTSDVTRHIRTHNPTKQWKCPVSDCDFGSHQQNALKKHMNKHTGAKPYPCTYCSESFGDPAILYKHVARTHEADSMYRCTLKGCRSTVRTAERAKAHFLEKHGISRSEDELELEKFFRICTKLPSPPLPSTSTSTRASSTPTPLLSSPYATSSSSSSSSSYSCASLYTDSCPSTPALSTSSLSPPSSPASVHERLPTPEPGPVSCLEVQILDDSACHNEPIFAPFCEPCLAPSDESLDDYGLPKLEFLDDITYRPTLVADYSSLGLDIGWSISSGDFATWAA